MDRGFVDVADIRTCRDCGRDYLHAFDAAEPYRPIQLEPWSTRGSDVSHGWRLDVDGHAHWVTHIAAVAPAGVFAFYTHYCPAPPRKGTPQVTTPDPFDEAESRPAVSFKNAAIGTTVTCVIDGEAKLVQARDFDTNKPDFWDDGNPKMTAVVDVIVDGEQRSLWAGKPSSMFRAIADAQRAAGVVLQKGGTLVVRYSDDKPNKDAKKNPQKIYQAHYTPPAATSPFDEPATPPAAPAAPTPPPAPAAAPEAAKPPWL